MRTNTAAAKRLGECPRTMAAHSQKPPAPWGVVGKEALLRRVQVLGVACPPIGLLAAKDAVVQLQQETDPADREWVLIGFQDLVEACVAVDHPGDDLRAEWFAAGRPPRGRGPGEFLERVRDRIEIEPRPGADRAPVPLVQGSRARISFARATTGSGRAR